ncbi:hypothetical protein FQN60_004384 [Etheostoma spectabile]|uniref:Uncharacterized protein n=1 Tax=Etheostoma spectabile TaxID=54343 RepID=A0A5J5CYM2_9PERO|nr:hypothetical protein FQN60_004384 [Etheostoma spectabile]
MCDRVKASTPSRPGRESRSTRGFTPPRWPSRATQEGLLEMEENSRLMS